MAACVSFLIALTHLIVLMSSSVVAASIPADSSSRSAADEEANLAIFIQASKSTITLIPRLLKVLWHEKNFYVVHYDKKIPKWERDYSSENLRKLSFLHRDGDKQPNNIVIMDPEVITYRGISMVINTMNAMQKAIDGNDKWDYFINISGSDYPLMSPSNMRKLFGSFDFLELRRSFFTVASRHWWIESHKYRATRLFTDTSLGMEGLESKLVDSFQKHPLRDLLGFQFVAAEAWMILHRDFVHHLLTDPIARRYYTAFAYFSEPEEHFFVTLAYNTPQFNDTMLTTALRNVIWSFNGTHAGQHPYHTDEQNNKGEWIFLPTVRKSGCIFTRKISKQDSPFLDIIDKTISGVASDPDEDGVEKQLYWVRQNIMCKHPDKIYKPELNCTKLFPMLI